MQSNTDCFRKAKGNTVRLKGLGARTFFAHQRQLRSGRLVLLTPLFLEDMQISWEKGFSFPSSPVTPLQRLESQLCWEKGAPCQPALETQRYILPPSYGQKHFPFSGSWNISNVFIPLPYQIVSLFRTLLCTSFVGSQKIFALYFLRGGCQYKN